jgi:histidinol-phosphatase (PHP family)
MWANYHTHTAYCDGKTPVTDCVRQALALNMVSLGISSHAPLPFDCKWCMKPNALGAYLSDLDAARQQYPGIDIYKGLEIDFIPGVISPDTFRNQLDYTIGSIHFVDQFADGRRWEIDGLHSFFLEGLEAIFRNNIEAAITRYYHLTREMVRTACPDVVGHLDKIKIQNTTDKLFSESDAWYRREVNDTLDVIAAAGAVLEVNTRGIYQKKSTTTYPGPWVLEMAFQKHIPITISSDAHHPDDLTNQFQETATLLADIGYRHLSLLRNGSWQPIPFTPHGLDIR